MRSANKDGKLLAKTELDALQKLQDHLENERPARSLELTREEKASCCWNCLVIVVGGVIVGKVVAVVVRDQFVCSLLLHLSKSQQCHHML